MYDWNFICIFKGCYTRGSLYTCHVTTGNNIPTDIMKAVSSAIQRNVDCQSIYQEHHSQTLTLRNEINALEHEKSLQVTNANLLY